MLKNIRHGIYASMPLVVGSLGLVALACEGGPGDSVQSAAPDVSPPQRTATVSSGRPDVVSPQRTATTNGGRADAEKAPVPLHVEPFVLESGVHENLGQEPVVAFRDVVRSPDAPWLQLHFSDHNLGRRSHIAITSRRDGSEQRLDREGLARWQDSSAFFNGDEVEVALTVAPGESGIFFRIQEITVGDLFDEARLTPVAGSQE